MTVGKFAGENGYRILSTSSEAFDREFSGVYVCDLLSWAMTKVNSGDIWVTVHTNLNIVAVAVLTGAACVIIPEDIAVEEATLQRAEREGVIIASSSHNSAEIVARVHKAIL